MSDSILPKPVDEVQLKVNQSADTVPNIRKAIICILICHLHYLRRTDFSLFAAFSVRRITETFGAL